MSGNGIELRSGTPEDANELALVLERANAQRDNKPLPNSATDDAVKELIERMIEPGSWAYLATYGERIVGFALGYAGDGIKGSSRESDAEYLSLLMVEPDYWGMRISSKLLEVVADRARSNGKRELTLWTRDDANEHARGIYEHLGFSLSGTKRNSRHGTQVHYSKKL